MAIDPSISLGVRPVQLPPSQIQNPVEQFGQILSLRNLMTQGQLGQLGLQTQQLELQQLQRQEQQRQDFAKYLQQNLSGGQPAAAPLQTAPAAQPVMPTPAPGATPGAPLGTLMNPQAPAIRPDAKSGPYLTTLTPPEEAQFQAWVQNNHIPFDPSPTADYDMRGFWRSMMAGQSERSSANLHFPDTFKTPYHQSFSNESMYATGDAPHWEGNRLLDKSGKVVFDESQGGQAPAAPQAGAPGAPLGTLPSPAAVAPAAPAAAPPAMVGQGSSLFGRLNLGEIVTKFPDIGPAFAKQAIETQKNQTEAEIKFHENNEKIAGRLGSLGRSIRDATDPSAQFAPAIWQALSEKLIPDQVGRQMIADGYEKHKGDIQQFIDSAQNGKDSSEIAKNNLVANQDALKNAALIMRGVNSQADYDTKFLPNVTPYVRSVLGPTFSPQLKATAASFDVSGEKLPKTQLEQIQTDAVKLAAAMKQGPEAGKAVFDTLSPESQRHFAGVKTWQDVVQRGLTSEQTTTAAQAAATAAQAAANAAETKRHNLSSESTAKLNASIAAGRLQQEKIINGMKYGPGTQEYWVQQLTDNPDSIKEMPPEFRSSVGQKFRAQTGLPLPTPLTGTSITQEIAARNALDGISFIKTALQNPEIQKQIGPIMGRLGNAEQSAGTAVGLSPQAEQLAQQLRTRMRYFVFQEGKAVLGGRLPQKLMEALESSSANVKMDSNMLQGALTGAEGNTQSVLDNLDKQRFGGKMRSREIRGAEGTKLPEITSQAAYDALPKGAQYSHNGEVLTKK